MNARRPRGECTRSLHRLERAIADVTTHREAMLTGFKRPIKAPQHPCCIGKRLAEFCNLPVTIIHTDFYAGNLFRTRISNTPHRDVKRTVLLVGVIHCDGINHADGLNTGGGIPTAHHPVTFAPAICDFNISNPLGLLHAVQIRDEDTQWKAVFLLEGLPIPRITQHNAGVVADDI